MRQSIVVLSSLAVLILKESDFIAIIWHQASKGVYTSYKGNGMKTRELFRNIIPKTVGSLSCSLCRQHKRSLLLARYTQWLNYTSTGKI